MKIPDANPELCMQCVVACSMGYDTSIKVVEYVYGQEFSKVAPRSKGVVRLAIEAAQELGLLSVVGDSLYDANLTLNITLDFQITDDVKKSIFREYLQRYEPYIRFHTLITLGSTSDLAARRTSVFYDRLPLLNGENNTLAKWGLYAGTLQKIQDVVGVASTIEAASITETVENLRVFLNSLDTEMASTVFIQTFLGLDVCHYLSADIQSDLSKAMSLAVSNPEEAVICMGRALEDYLKLLASTRNVILEHNNGSPIETIGAIIGKLRGERVLAKGHGNVLRGLEILVTQELFLGLSSWRNMPVHGRDSEANVRWSLSTEVALVGTFQLLLSIRSTYHYLVENRLSY